MNKKKLLMISFDACGSKDLEYLASRPAFSEFMKDAAVCRNVKSVYPSLTYPAHTSIITGRYPIHSGITNNLRFQPGLYWNPDWMWYRRCITGTTLYDEASKHGYTTASLFWPVTASAHITCNMPEIFANRKHQHQADRSLLNGSKLYQLNMLYHYGHQLDNINQPNLDNFTCDSLIRTIRRYHTDMIMVHFCDVDTLRHRNGVSSPVITAALDRHDRRLERITDALKKSGVYDDTVIVLLGDHYQKDTHTILYPNYVLRKAGLIKTDGMLRVLTYKAFCLNCDGSAYIYVKDRREIDNVRDILTEWMNRDNSGIKRIFEKSEIKAMGADPRADFMLEAEDGYYFQDLMEQREEKVSDAGKRGQKATHGYHPDDPEYRTFFMMKGPGVRKNAEISHMSLVDEGPTIARLFGWDLGRTDGHAVDTMLENMRNM